MKLIRITALLAAALLIWTTAFADEVTFWEAHWQPGEYMVAFTPEEDARVAGIMEEATRKSEGTMTRTVADQDSVEAQYERFLNMHPDGKPITSDDVQYADIGWSTWAAGPPDDQSISRDDAWKIALEFLIENDLATPETLAHYYPQVSYDTGDPENPAWHITPECYDYEESDLPVTVWLVSVYAHDGSICGYREVNGAG